MLREVRILIALFSFCVMVFIASFLPTSMFIKVDLERTKVYTSGDVKLYREPLWNNIYITFSEELVTPDGRTYSSPLRGAPYESTDKVISYTLNNDLLPCLEQGSTYRVSRKFLFFRSSTTEVRVENLG